MIIDSCKPSCDHIIISVFIVWTHIFMAHSSSDIVPQILCLYLQSSTNIQTFMLLVKTSNMNEKKNNYCHHELVHIYHYLLSMLSMLHDNN